MTAVDKVAALDALMQDCARAMYDDTELTVSGNSVNASEAAPALQAVAEILGIDGPRTLLELPCEEGSL